MEKVIQKMRIIALFIVAVFLVCAIFIARAEYLQWQYVETNGFFDSLSKLPKTFHIAPVLLIVLFLLFSYLRSLGHK